ncbi:MAG: AAA-like domain-containing protein [Synechococcales bacterium]|nr:AAA-like domain-containing protein [Synechococcales bacterium]
MSTPPKSQSAKRKRGVLLSLKGWQRLQAAEQQVTQVENQGRPFTLQELSDRTGLSSNTLARVRGRKIAVDQQTLEYYFRAFDLILTLEDYSDTDFNGNLGRLPGPPNGQLPIDSPLYISRPPAESLCLESILQPGGLIRVKAPRQMGKTSLVARTMSKARDYQFSTVMISLRLADSGIFRDLKRFLQWLCAVVSQDLELSVQIADYWDDLFGASYNCTSYFERFLLKHLEQPLVLALDDVDVVFDYPELVSDFFGMLRAWYEKARYGDLRSELWQNLRLVLVYATEATIPLNLTQSPFNAGMLTELPSLTPSQVIELVNRYGLLEGELDVMRLMELVGGIPYLTHLGLYALRMRDQSVEELIDHAIAPDGIYSHHLRSQLLELQAYPELLGVLRKVVLSSEPVGLEPVQAFQLQSKGLVKVHQHQIVPSCDLYRRFFSHVLG